VKDVADNIEDVVTAIEDLTEILKGLKMPAPVVNVPSAKVSMAAPVVNIPEQKKCGYEITVTSRDGSGNIKSIRMVPI